MAIRRGIENSNGDAIVVMMADDSDNCRDVVRYRELLDAGYGCVFGSRFIKGIGAERALSLLQTNKFCEEITGYRLKLAV